MKPFFNPLRIPMPRRPGLPEWKCAALFLTLLLAPAALAPLHADTGFFERRAMAIAKRTFQDGLYDSAQTRLLEFQTKYPKSDFAGEVRWLLGQTHYFLGNPAKALEAFQNPPAGIEDKLKAGYLFWEAESLAALNRLDEAAARYNDFLKTWAADERAAAARINLSSILHRSGKTAEALASLEPLVQRGPGDPTGRQAALQKARILIATSKPDEAAALLLPLTEGKPDAPAAAEAGVLSAELALQQKKPDAALDFLRKITSASKIQPRDLVPRAWFQTGLAHLARESWDDAAAAFEQAYTLSADPAVIEPAVVRHLEASAKANNLAKAALRVRQFVRKKDGAAVSGLYAIGQFYFNEGNDDAAIGELDGLINNHPESPWTWRAKLLLAQALQRKGNLDSALETLEETAKGSKDPALTAQARLLQGEWLFGAGRHPEAAAQFLAAATAHPASAEEALFRAALSWSRAGRLDEFSKVYDQLARRDPPSRHVPVLLMEKAALLEAAGQADEARRIYTEVSTRPGSPQQTAEALYQLALAAFESGESESALTSLRAIEKDHPDFREKGEVAYLRILLERNLGQIKGDAVRAAWEAFLQAHPGHKRATDAEFQIAQWFARQGNLAEARARCLALAEKNPKHPLASHALYQAGSAAFGAGEFKDALAILEKIPETAPVKTDARLLQIRCLMQQGNFDGALQVADSVLSTRKDDFAWVEAGLRKMGALYTLAANDPKKYEAALKVADTLLASNVPNASQRNEAGFVRGQILAKLDQPDKALNAYLDVVYGRLLPAETTQAPAEPEFHWFIKSGLAAASMREDQGDIRGAVEIYRILERLGDPNREEFRKKIEDLKSRHFLFEET